MKHRQTLVMRPRRNDLGLYPTGVKRAPYGLFGRGPSEDADLTPGQARNVCASPSNILARALFKR
jgi:hypothetical protein